MVASVCWWVRLVGGGTRLFGVEKGAYGGNRLPMQPSGEDGKAGTTWQAMQQGEKEGKAGNRLRSRMEKQGQIWQQAVQQNSGMGRGGTRLCRRLEKTTKSNTGLCARIEKRVDGGRLCVGVEKR